MPESLRSAYRNLLRGLSALPPFLRSAARSVVESLKVAFEPLDSTSGTLEHRSPDVVAPSAPAPEGGAGGEEQGYSEMLAELGAEPPPPESADDLKDTAIRALSDNLRGLRDLGDQLARAEQDKLALAARVEELEAGAGEDAVVARLERKLEQREGVLARTRERLTSQRAKTDDWKSKAAERWHEIGSLRKQLKELERALEEARDAARPGPLPQQAESGSPQGPRAEHRSARAS